MPLAEKDLQIYRIFCVVVTVLIPILGGIYESTNPNINSFVIDRMILVFVGLSVVALSYKIQLLKVWMRQVVYFFNFSVTMWSLLVASVNQFSIEYVFSLVMVILASSVCFTTVNLLSWYFLLTISSSTIAGLFVPDPYVSRNIFIGSIATVGLIAFLALRSRLLIQKNLEVSEDLMKTIFNESADAMFLVNREKQITVDCNDSAVNMFKARNKHGLVGVHLSNLPELAIEVDALKQLQELILKEGKWEKELEFKTFSGPGFWGDMVVKDIDISDEVYHLARITDITEKKKAHEEVAWLATFPENDPAPIIELSLKGKITYVNPMASFLFPDLETKELSHPILNGIKPSVKELLKNDSKLSFREVQYNQSYYHQNISLVPDQNLVRIYNIEITDRIKAEKKIIASEAKNQALINAIPDLMFQINNHGVIVSYKPPKDQQISIYTDDIVGKKIFDVFPKDVVKSLKVNIINAFKSRKIQVFDYQLLHQDKRKDFEARVVVSGPTEVVAIVRDITERKELDRRLIAAREAALETSRMRSEFVANMSHELRTPLHGILGFTDLLLDSGLEEHQSNHASVIRDSSETLLKLINDILDFSKLESGKLEMDTMDFEFRDCIQNSLKSLINKASEKGLDIEINIKHDIPIQLSGDPGRLRQILVNLVSNAIKFTEKGNITLGASMESKFDNRVEVHFVLEDSGIGIPEDKLDMIFYSFAQADGSATRKFGGTGLGLALTKQLVELMNGKIWVESRYGVGSKFHFTVKFDLVKSQSAKIFKLSENDLMNKNILVVDSLLDSRKNLENIFSRWKMNTTLVSSGQRALLEIEKARSQGKVFSYVIIDANIHEIDGFTLANHISKTEDLNHSMIMVLSSAGERGDAARCREIGVSAYLTKPFNPNQLLETLLAVESQRISNQEKLPLITRHSLRENKQAVEKPYENKLEAEFQN